MQHINKYSGDNLGGINKFWIVLSEHVSEIAVDPVEPYFKLILVPSGSIYYIYCTDDTMEFSEEKKMDSNGVYFQCTLKGSSPNNYNNLKLVFDELDTKEFLIIYLDNNGNYRLFGDIEEPLTLINNYTSTPRIAGFNANHLTFSRKMTSRQKFIQDPFA